MRRHLLLLTGALTAIASLSARQPYLKYDFSAGIPAGVKLYDEDGNEPSTDMAALGFTVGTPWIVTTEGTEGNMAACSTSWYKTPGTSSDWMVLPAVSVDSPDAVLRWRGRAGDPDYRDGYKVYISDSGNTPADFNKTESSFYTKSETYVWNDREISLAPYVGKEIYIAFVNESQDKSTLYIDDIFAGVPSVLEVTSTIPRVLTTPGYVEVSGIVTNTSSSSVNGFEIVCSFGGSESERHRFETLIQAGGTSDFSFISERPIDKNETLAYTLEVKGNNETSSTAGKVSAYGRRVVAEEVTGTWCGYCVRGIVAMRLMKEKYPDSFLGIAVHGSSGSYPEPMAMDDYTGWLFSQFGMSGYPHLTVNRLIAQTGDPGKLLDYYNRAIERDHYTGLDLEADVDEDTNTITASTSLFSARSLSGIDWRLVYVLIENDVHSDEILYDSNGDELLYNGWEQTNYYSGGSMGELGGFENLPDPVPGRDMWYQDVARYISEGYDGIAGSLPTDIQEGEKITHTHSFTLPETVRDPKNTELAVLLLNGRTGEVFNAEKYSLYEKFGGSYVHNPASDIELNVLRNGVMLEIIGTNLSEAALYTPDGICMASATGSGHNLAINTYGYRGMCLLMVTSNSGIRTVKKIIL